MISVIISTRNALVHRGTFVSKAPWDEFRLMLSIVDRLILALLEYRGPYVERENFEARGTGAGDLETAGQSPAGSSLASVGGKPPRALETQLVARKAWSNEL